MTTKKISDLHCTRFESMKASADARNHLPNLHKTFNLKILTFNNLPMGPGP